MSDLTIIEKHSLVLRLVHWLNVFFLSVMIWSGCLIYWADQAFLPLPKFLVKYFDLDYRLAEGMGWHFFFMWFFTVNGIVYFLYLCISGDWRERLPYSGILKDSYNVLLHDLGLRAEAPSKRGKYNAVQRLAYSGALFMGLGSLVTGLAIYKPIQLGWLTGLLGGYQAARFEHFILMLGILLFIGIHVVQVLRAGWNNFRAMVAGYEIEKD
jgi:thiosulfate reductase cytochrome b subunit